MMSTNDFVVGGASFQLSAGDGLVWPASQVWVLFDVPATTTSLPENFQPGSVGVSGNSGFRRGGYGGPCPPSGSHHCHFMLSALDVPTLGLQAGASKADVEKAMRMSLPNSRRRATHGARDRSRRRRSIGRSSCRSA